ncbi:MAG TPA: penicillin-binding transpeptidase domain-containing protein, partial [Candidatus Acidoferrales bacterium]|nr:penicillin-binding transpeptidase domain-containing protein [Candidatus Acidoferrales bacterium]
MLILDELKKNDPQLRLVAAGLAAGLFILLTGLWWVQVVSAREYRSHLETQSYRTVRIPAMRGKILDCEGRVLAENRPSYSLSLYLDDLQEPFEAAYRQLHRQALAAQQQAIAAREKELGRSLTKAERESFAFTSAQLEDFREQARYQVASAVVSKIGQELGQPLTLDPQKFERDYKTRLAMPYTVIADASPEQVARFEEQSFDLPGADLELQPVRVYPLGTTAGHVLGYLQRDNNSGEGEDAYFSYRLPDYRGVVGIEGGFDSLLRGRAGEESVLVNSLGYRQSENILEAPEPGYNVVLTIDLDIQRAAEESLLSHQGPDVRAAIVVMDVRSGDILAMVSSPAINPDYAANDPKYLADPKLRPEINRATQENYAPGSIFKPIVGLAALQAGLNPDALVDNPGYVMVGRRHIGDLAPPGEYNFRKAIAESCNTYFITVGLHAGIENIIRMCEKFHFGERTGLPTRQETKGILPTLSQVRGADWHDGDSANICIGQGQIAVTPMQMAVAYAAIANGGTVLWPRLVERIEPQDPSSGEAMTNFPAGLVRGHIGVSARNLTILREAMLAETEEGTGTAAQVAGLKICGKTGTAQVMDAQNREIDRTTWFASFAPYDHPRYAVVVMMEGRDFWGSTCAPIAHDIYEELLKKENSPAPAMASRG